MKKRFIFIMLISLSLSSMVFSQNGEAEINSFVPVYNYNIENQFNITKKGIYYFKFFDASEPPYIYNSEKQDFIKTEMIQKLHNIYENGSEVYLDGPVVYLYYDSIVLTKEVIQSIGEYVKSFNNTMVCVDISNCYFESKETEENYGLPADSFINLDNLYWLYLGNMLNSKLPENLCMNCKNLMAIYVWNVSGIKNNVFTNIPSDTAVVLENNTKLLCSDYLNLFRTESDDVPEIEENPVVEEKKNDNKESSYTYNPVSTGVTWLVDEWGRMEPQEPVELEDEFGLYDIINDENFVIVEEDDLAMFPDLINILYENLDNPEFRLLENTSFLNIDNYWFYDSYYPDFSNPSEIVKTFLSSYLSNTKLYEELLGFSSNSKLEINLDNDIPPSIKDYKNLQIFIINSYDYESFEIPIMICLEGEINGEITKELSEIKLKKVDDRWYVMNIYNGWLSYLKGRISSDIEE